VGLDTVRVVSRATVAEDTAELIAQIKALAIVHGTVTLASGRTADYYVDMRRVTLDGAVAPIIGRVMRSLVADWDFEAVGGLTLGADPVATAMMHAAAAAGERLDAFVVRKQGKAHGLQRRIEGSPVAGRRVLAVEDTSTTGGSVLTAVDALQEAGAQVVGVARVPLGDLPARPWFGVRPIGTLSPSPVRVNGLSSSKPMPVDTLRMHASQAKEI
jgi:orotate phosphoribosyltransferase